MVNIFFVEKYIFKEIYFVYLIVNCGIVIIKFYFIFKILVIKVDERCDVIKYIL